jgi:hypothetical protein
MVVFHYAQFIENSFHTTQQAKSEEHLIQFSSFHNNPYAAAPYQLAMLKRGRCFITRE